MLISIIFSNLKIKNNCQNIQNLSSMNHGLWIILIIPVDRRLVFMIIIRFHMNPRMLYSGGLLTLLEVQNAYISNAHILIIRVPYSNEISMVLL